MHRLMEKTCVRKEEKAKKKENARMQYARYMIEKKSFTLHK